MNSTRKGVVYMIISALSFSVMQILTAMSSKAVPVFEQMIFRNVVTAVFAFVMLKRKGVKAVFGHEENAVPLLLRCTFGFIGMYFLFYATAHGNQGKVAILSKFSPFFVIFCSILFLHDKPKTSQWLALILAVIGCLFTANPTFNGLENPDICAFLCSVFSGFAYFCISYLKGKEDSDVIVFDFSVFTTVICVVVTIFNFKIPSTRDFFLLLGMSLFAAIGQLTMTYSYVIASASDVSVYNYLAIPFTMLLSIILLNEVVKTSTLIGSVLVVISGVISCQGIKKRKKENE